MPFRLSVAAPLAATALAVCLAAGAAAQGVCSPSRLDIRAPAGGDGARQSFIVELADTPEARARGLMHRESLAPDAGMLFVYETPRRAEFWMKNTLIPLDMIFADPAGLVTRVHENAVPGDLTPIPGGEGVKFVLEINGGLARRAGIVPGSQLRHPAIGKDALWPCE